MAGTVEDLEGVDMTFLLAIYGFLKNKWVLYLLACVGCVILGWSVKTWQVNSKQAKVIVKEAIRYVEARQKVESHYNGSFSDNCVLSGQVSLHSPGRLSDDETGKGGACW